MANILSPDTGIVSGAATVLHSGCVHTYANNSVVIRIGNLRIEYVFTESGNDPDLSIVVKSEDNLLVELKNFSSPTGVGTDSPIKLGVMQGQRLSMAFTVHALSKDSIKMLSYTFFLGGD